MIGDVRARQSFGIPVGGNASRLLAEVLLNDMDRALKAEGYVFTRYVDDFRIFIQEGQDPYAAIAFLSERLMTNEGLFLAAAKTRVHSVSGYVDGMNISSGEDMAQADESAAARLLREIYDSEESEDAVEALKSEDLVGDLEEELEEEFWDVGKIRVEIEADLETVAIDGRDFLYGVFQLGDPQKAAPALERLFGPKILRFAEAAWSSTDQSKRIALCDLAIHDRQIVADHCENRLVIGGKRWTRFHNAFKIKLPVEPTAIARVWRPDSSPKLPPIDIDFADIILPPERR
jgi:hypothetical protein